MKYTNNYHERMAKRRVIMRIEVGRSVPKALARAVDQFGSTNASVQTRVVHWLAGTDDLTQAAILQQITADVDLRKILRAIASQTSPNDHRRHKKNAPVKKTGEDNEASPVA